MFNGITIALRSSITFRRSPAGLNAMKYPSCSVRFPANNLYGSVIARCNNNEDGPKVMVKEDGDEEGNSKKVVSIVVDKILIIGPKKDAMAAAVAVRGGGKTLSQKIISLVVVSLVGTWLTRIWGNIGSGIGKLIAMFGVKEKLMKHIPISMFLVALTVGTIFLARKEARDDSTGRYKFALAIVNHLIGVLKSNFVESGANAFWEYLFNSVASAAGLTAYMALVNPYVVILLVSIGVTLTIMIAPEVVNLIKVMISEEKRLKSIQNLNPEGTMVKQDRDGILKGLMQDIKLNPGGNAITTTLTEAKTGESCNIENAENETKENKGSKEEEEEETVLS